MAVIRSFRMTAADSRRAFSSFDRSSRRSVNSASVNASSLTSLRAAAHSRR